MIDDLKEKMIEQSSEKFDLSKESQKIRIIDAFVKNNFSTHGIIYYDDMMMELDNKIVAIGITAKELELSIKNDNKKNQKALLLSVHSNKVKQIRAAITKKTFTRELEAEYEISLKEAVLAFETNDFTFFDLIAQLKGVTAKQYAQLVINNATSMKGLEKQSFRKIGNIRSFISDLIDDNKIFQAEKMINYIKDMKPEVIISASNDQLMELISTYSN